jgi:hypothetical protein
MGGSVGSGDDVVMHTTGLALGRLAHALPAGCSPTNKKGHASVAFNAGPSGLVGHGVPSGLLDDAQRRAAVGSTTGHTRTKGHFGRVREGRVSAGVGGGGSHHTLLGVSVKRGQ